MDIIPIATDTHVRPLFVTLHLGHSCMRRVAAELSFTSSDPYALTLSIHLDDQSVPWIFARGLLSHGLTTPTGDGDVRIRPDFDDEGHPVVAIELFSRQGHALVEVHTADAIEFATLTDTVVASGHESAHLDIDAIIAAIRGARGSPDAIPPSRRPFTPDPGSTGR